MPSFLGLPPEIRLQIYQELVSPELHSVHIGSPLESRLVCYNNQNVHTSILRVCKQIYNEASPILFKHNDITSKLYIYLILSTNEARGDIESAFQAVSSSRQFQSIRTCSLEIAWSPDFSLDPEHDWWPAQDNFDLLHTKLETIRGFVSRIKSLEKIEVLCPHYFPYDGECLEPLSRGPRNYGLSVFDRNWVLEM